MKTELQARIEFVAYFLDLKLSMGTEGGKVEKTAEWDFFISHLIDEGEIPPEAINWKCHGALK